MSEYTKLAEEFKSRDNEDYIGIVVGTVESIIPLSVTISGGKAIFPEVDANGNKLLYVCKNATEYQIPFQLESPNGGVSGTITHEGLKQGDKVAVIATEDNQKLFVVDKLT